MRRALNTRSAASSLLYELGRQADLLGTFLRRFGGRTIVERARTQQRQIALFRHLLVFDVTGNLFALELAQPIAGAVFGSEGADQQDELDRKSVV